MNLHSRVLDYGLSIITSEADTFVICTQEPTTYDEAWLTEVEGGFKIGHKQTYPDPLYDSPEDSDLGRKVVVLEFIDGEVLANAVAAYWAVLDTINERLLASGPLYGEVSVTNGEAFEIATCDIEIPSSG